MIVCEFEDGGKGKLRHVVVDTIVMRGNKILLVKRVKTILEGGKWGIIGGFVERDETIKQAAEREVFEETGWRVENLKLLRLKDLPDRPHEDRQNISIVLFCNATKREGIKDDESEKISWFDLNSVPPDDEIAFDHADDIEMFRKYLKQKIDIPVLNNL